MSSSSPRQHRSTGRHGILTWIAVAAAVAGVVVLGVFITSQQSAPTPPASEAGRVRPPAPSSPQGAPSSPGRDQASTPQVGAAAQHPLPVSRPESIDIPAIDVHSAVIAVGKNPDGTIEVPQPGPNLDKAAWYDQSPTPGRIGPSVIIGHVDTTEGPSVFFELGDVRRGDTIRIRRADASTVVYTVDGVRAYADKSDFPTSLVYGGDVSSPNLRVVTCTNFDEETGHYEGNLVVFAHLTAAHHLPS